MTSPRKERFKAKYETEIRKLRVDFPQLVSAENEDSLIVNGRIQIDDMDEDKVPDVP